MANLMKKIRSVLKNLGRKAKLSISIALSIPGFLKVEVAYEKTLAPPDLTRQKGGGAAGREALAINGSEPQID